MWDRRARVLKVHDGDTITVEIDQGFNDRKTLEGLRLQGVYAPELNQEGGTDCQVFVAHVLALHDNGSPWPYVVTTARTRTDHEVETLGRYVGVLTSPDGSWVLNASVSAYVAQQGYSGGIGAPAPVT